ncbi:MAG: hypothetical protein JWN79_2984 [Gemmatimonadetes bacterium]|jgi:hypothetical protein|nr:hypothetical protein [Gemmatimonadota bacterium]
MASNDRGVPRGDHVAGEQDKADSVKRQEAGPRGDDVAPDSTSLRSADANVLSDATPEPDRTKGSDRGGTAGWGGAPAGGSVIDKRSPDKKG